MTAKMNLLQRFTHNVLDWHAPYSELGSSFDGASVLDRCKYCNHRIMRDSQANWFTYQKNYKTGECKCCPERLRAE